MEERLRPPPTRKTLPTQIQSGQTSTTSADCLTHIAGLAVSVIIKDRGEPTTAVEVHALRRDAEMLAQAIWMAMRNTV